MAKRFIDSSIFRKDFMRSMEAPYKALFIYLMCECDHAGLWDVELDIAGIRLGMDLDEAKALEAMCGAVVEVEPGKWWLKDFVEFQYGDLNPENRVHESVIKRLRSVKLWSENKGLVSPLQGAKDKDKDKDKEKEKEKERAKANTELPDVLDTTAFRSAWGRWVQHRSEIRKPVKPTMAAAMIKQLEAMGHDRAVACIDHTIAMGWQGLREAEANGKPKHQPATGVWNANR